MPSFAYGSGQSDSCFRSVNESWWNKSMLGRILNLFAWRAFHKFSEYEKRSSSVSSWWCTFDKFMNIMVFMVTWQWFVFISLKRSTFTKPAGLPSGGIFERRRGNPLPKALCFVYTNVAMRAGVLPTDFRLLFSRKLTTSCFILCF